MSSCGHGCYCCNHLLSLYWEWIRSWARYIYIFILASLCPTQERMRLYLINKESGVRGGQTICPQVHVNASLSAHHSFSYVTLLCKQCIFFHNSRQPISRWSDSFSLLGWVMFSSQCLLMHFRAVRSSACMCSSVVSEKATEWWIMHKLLNNGSQAEH